MYDSYFINHRQGAFYFRSICIALSLLAVLVSPCRAEEQKDSEPDKTETRKERLKSLQDLGTLPLAVSAALLSFEKTSGHSYPNSFDYSFKLSGGSSVRVYRTHAMMKTLQQGAAITRDMGNGHFHQFEVANFETSPLLHGSIGVKMSRIYPRKKIDLALVRMPKINSGLPLDSESNYLAALSYAGSGGEHNIFKFGALKTSWRRTDTAFLYFIGGSPPMVGDGLLEMRTSYGFNAEAPKAFLFGLKPYFKYEQAIDWMEMLYATLQMPNFSARDASEIISNNRKASAGFSTELPKGIKIRYGLETGRGFDKRLETASIRAKIGKSYDLSVLYAKDRGNMSFYLPWEKRRTRIQLTRRSGPVSWGAYCELRPGDPLYGVALMIGGEPDEPLPLVPENNYSKPYTDPTSRATLNAGQNLCGRFRSFQEALAGMTTPQQVSEFSSCLNYSQDGQNDRLNTPEEIFTGAEANCNSTSWLQSKILAAHGYETYIVSFHGTQMLSALKKDTRYSVSHAVSAYRDPATGSWNIIDYNTILKTNAKTIQEALEIYDPSQTGFTVSDPDKLQWQGTYANPAFKTLKEWITGRDVE